MIYPKFKTPYYYQPTAKDVLTCNDIPRFRESQAAVNRFVIIPFDHFIPPAQRIEDYHEHLLKTEGSGILNWALAGAKLMQETHVFTTSERSEELAHENKLIGNPVYAFMEETYEFSLSYTDPISPDFMFGNKETREKDATGYREFCSRNNIGLSSLPKFRTELARFCRESKFMEQIREKDDATGNKGKRAYVGLRQKGVPVYDMVGQTFDDFKN